MKSSSMQKRCLDDPGCVSPTGKQDSGVGESSSICQMWYPNFLSAGVIT